MQLSIIIVNYNVRYFLEPCLKTVREAVKGLDAEVIVVDNASSDDSVKMVREKFPWVRLIVNEENVGFSKANNRGIRESKGKYVLLLNPDTLVQENSFTSCYKFMESHPDAGAVGVRMLDGSGTFLPESKRGFPSPFVAFSKATGLSVLFPRSERFNKYHLGYLPEDETHEVDVLTGAFMFLRREVLDKIGLLDEEFFMYGEDIDLSYRIVQAGYKNYYFPETNIIHYKGESTKKGSLNYVMTFYKAMIIFARKHFHGSRKKNLVRFLQLAVYGRALVTLFTNLFKRISSGLIDLLVIYGVFFLTEQLWARGYHADPDYYPLTNAWINYPVYSVFFVVAGWFAGLYEKSPRSNIVLRSALGGLLLSLIFYALAPLDYRSSRAILVIGGVITGLYLLVSRMAVQWRKTGRWQLDQTDRHRMVIVGAMDEIQRVRSLMEKAGIDHELVGMLAPSKETMTDEHASQLENLREYARLHGVNEIIFCERDVPVDKIIHWIRTCGPRYHYKIIVEGGEGIIGSRSKNTAGQIYTMEPEFQIADPVYIREKRSFDILAAVLLLLFSPVLCWFSGSPGNYFIAIFQVLAGRKTWVGYAPSEVPGIRLPAIKKGVFHVLSGTSLDRWTAREIHHENFIYARDYSMGRDLGILVRNLRAFGK